MSVPAATLLFASADFEVGAGGDGNNRFGGGVSSGDWLPAATVLALRMAKATLGSMSKENKIMFM